MSKNAIPTDWRKCATCIHWCGNAKSNAFCTYVEFDNNDRGRCAGGGFNMLDMPPMASCLKWERRFR